MKRFFCLLLILLFLPVLSFSDDDPFVGIWINDTPSGMKSRTIVTYQVLSSGTVFYSRQEHFFNGDPAKVETAVYSSETTGESIRIKDGDQVVAELFRVNAYQLSSDPRKTYGFYNRVLESNTAYLSARSFEEQAIKEAEAEKEKRIKEAEGHTDPCGKWAYALDVSGVKHPGLSYDYMSVDLFIFEDGSAYMILGTKSSESSSLDFNYSDGMWIGDASLIRIKFKDNVFNGWINEEGYLCLQFTSSSIFHLVRVVPSDSVT